MVDRIGPARSGRPTASSRPTGPRPNSSPCGRCHGGARAGSPVHWHSDDTDAFGAPFLICDFVRGDAPIPWTPDGGPAFDETTRARLAEQFVAALAALHRFDWRGDAGRDHRRRHRCPARRRATASMSGRAGSGNGPSARADARMGGDLVARERARRAADQHRAWRLSGSAIFSSTRAASPRSSIGSSCVSATRSRMSAGSACRPGAAARPICAISSTREALRDRYAALTGLDIDGARRSLLGGLRHLQARGDALRRAALFRAARL